jgi:hypothetical protein
MKKIILFLILISIGTHYIQAQPTGAFQLIVPHQSNQRIIEYYVPITYTSSSSYPMVVGLHGCVGGANPAANFRDDLQFLADSIGAIIVCPNGLFSGSMDNPDHTMILSAIDTTIGLYNININEVYLTGFSCNGYVTAKHGTQELYNWAGIIPFNSAFSMNDFLNGSFDFSSQKPICLCIGTFDPGLSLNNRFRDSLITNNNVHMYNTMIGIGHTTNFPSFKNELMKCFNWIDSLGHATTAVNDLINQNFSFNLYPNPTKETLSIKNHKNESVEILIFDLSGKKVFQENFHKYDIIINTSSFKNGTYFIKLETNDGKVFKEKLIVIK